MVFKFFGSESSKPALEALVGSTTGLSSSAFPPPAAMLAAAQHPFYPRSSNTMLV